MKKLLLLLLIATTALAQPVEWFSAEKVQIELNVSSAVKLIQTGPLPYVEKLKADILFVPRQSLTLTLLDFETNPEALSTTEKVRYVWKTPATGVDFDYRAEIETRQNYPRVRASIPLIEIDYGDYTKPTKNIDSDNKAIIEKAKELAQGHQDMFELVSSIGMWVKNNVEYNLSTLTAEVSQPASWVLANKYGVCDEITSLFIALLRAQGIPARFVSGMAYTDSAQNPGWNAHGWAEVYFPGIGWVPYDITFGEFGWVDPGHIPLKYSNDPQEPATYYEWKARDVQVAVQNLTINAERLNSTGKSPSGLQMTISPLRQRVGFGSANGVILTVENTEDSYAAWEFNMAKVNGMTILSQENQQIILPPKTTKQLFWAVQVNELNKEFQYELPIVVSTIRNDTAKTAFFVGQWDSTLSLEQVKEAQKKLAKPPEEPFHLSCALKTDRIYTDKGTLMCAVQNNKVTPLTLSLCYKTCMQLEAEPESKIARTFDITAETPGRHEIKANATSGAITKTAILTLLKFDKPQAELVNITAPEQLSYNDKFEVSFTITKKSFSKPRNVTITTRRQDILEIGALTLDQEIALQSTGDQIIANHIPLEITYKDDFGNSYEFEKDIKIKVKGAPWYKWIFDLVHDW